MNFYIPLIMANSTIDRDTTSVTSPPVEEIDDIRVGVVLVLLTSSGTLVKYP